jgi:hypothetical protein
MNMTSYDRGFSDGYAEGYGAKLADVGAPFMPAGTAEEVERIADWLLARYAALVPTRADAIGMARGMIQAASNPR